MKFSIHGLAFPTPKKARKLGNALLAFALFMGSSAYLAGYPNVTVVVGFVGGMGKFLSEFFVEDK